MLKNNGLKSISAHIKFESISGYRSDEFITTENGGAAKEVVMRAIKELCRIGAIAGYDVKGAASLGAAQGEAALQGKSHACR